jgi:hypothetical protein
MTKTQRKRDAAEACASELAAPGEAVAGFAEPRPAQPTPLAPPSPPTGPVQWLGLLPRLLRR